jgi:hypothetical protein
MTHCTRRLLSFGSSIVSDQIGEGEAQQTFTVHEILLSDRSERLTTIMGKAHPQDSHKIVALKDVDPQAFALHIQYLYTGYIPSKPSEDAAPESDEYTALCRLYVFDYEHQDVGAQDAACDANHAKVYEYPAAIQDALPRSEHIAIIITVLQSYALHIC